MNTKNILSHSLIYITLVMFGFFFVASTAFATEVEIENDTDITIETTDDNDDAVETKDKAKNEVEEEDTDTSDDTENTDDDVAEESSDETESDDEDTKDTTEDRDDNILRASIKARMDVQQERREELQEKKEMREAEIQNRIEESRAVRIDMRVALGKRIVVRLGNIHDRLEAILGKISNRIEIMSENEATTRDMKTQVTEAERHVNEAQTHIANLEAMIDTWVTINTEQDPQELSAQLQANKATFKETLHDAGQSLRSTHKSLKELVRMMKSYEKDNRIETRVETETNVEI